MTDSAQQLVSLVDVREHARRRRPWNRAFSASALKGYEEIMDRRVDQLVELFAGRAVEGRQVDVGKSLGAFTCVSSSCLLDAFPPPHRTQYLSTCVM